MASSISQNGGGRFRAVNAQKRPVNEPTPCPSNPPDTEHSTSNGRGWSARGDTESVAFGHKIPTSPLARIAFPSRSRSAHWSLAPNKNGEPRHTAHRQSFASPRRVSNISGQSRIPRNFGNSWRARRGHRQVIQHAGPSNSEKQSEHGVTQFMTEHSPMLVETPRPTAPAAAEAVGGKGLVDPPATLSRPQKMNILRVLLESKDRIMETCAEHGALKYQCPCYWTAMAELVAEKVGWRFDPMVLKRKFTGDGLGASHKPREKAKDEWHDTVQEWRSALANHHGASIAILEPEPPGPQALHGVGSLSPAIREAVHSRLDEHLNTMADLGETPDKRGISSVIVGAVLSGNHSSLAAEYDGRIATGLFGWLGEKSIDGDTSRQSLEIAEGEPAEDHDAQSLLGLLNHNESYYRHDPTHLATSNSRNRLPASGHIPKPLSRAEMVRANQTCIDEIPLSGERPPQPSQPMQAGGSQLSPSKRKPGLDPPHAPLPKKLRPGQPAEQAKEVQRAQQGPAQLLAARPSNRDGGKSQGPWSDYHKSMHSKQSFEPSLDPSRPPHQGEGSSRSEVPDAGWQTRGPDSQARRGRGRTPRHSHGEPQATKGTQQSRHGSPSSHAAHPVSPGGAERRRSVTGQGSANEVAAAAARPPPRELINGQSLAKTPASGAWATRPQRWQRSQTQPPTEREILYQYQELQKQMSELQTGLKATNNDISRIKKVQEAGRRKMQLDENYKGGSDLGKAEENGEAEAGDEEAKRKKKKKKKAKQKAAVKTESD